MAQIMKSSWNVKLLGITAPMASDGWDRARVTMGGPTSICETVGARLGRRMDRWTAEKRAPKEFGTALQTQTFQSVYSGRHGLKIWAIPTERGRIRLD